MMKKILLLLVVVMIAITSFAYAADNLSVSQPIGGEVGYYDITSTPIGGDAAVDGTSLGKTPTTATIYVTGPPGHTITVNKAGYQPWSQYYSENPAAGQHISVVAVLIPTPVTLPATTVTVLPVTTPIGGDQGFYYINADQSGASVTFDNQNYGSAPVTVSVYTTATPGHTISVAKPGYQTWTQYYSGNPLAGQTINVYATLTPVVQTGNIYVNSNPSGASAVLDNGYDQVTTPGTFYTVSTGSHSVQVSAAGYQPYSTNIQVTSGSTSNVYATLTPNTQVGAISVSSVPKSGSVYVDGIFKGMTNIVVGDLSVGTHTVSISLAGYQTWTSNIAVNYGQTTYVTATLTPVSNPKTGDLQVSSSPSGAAIYLNGNYQGTTTSLGPISITGLTPGSYTLVLKKSGYQDYTTTTTIVAGTTAQVSAVLQPSGTPAQTASAEITSDPSGADVYINNVYKGITPLSFQNVPIDASQAYTVSIQLEGYQPYTTSGKISAGQNIQINAALTPVSSSTPSGINSTWLIVGAIAVICVIVVIAYVVMQRKNDKEPPKAT
jgi:hypothetical protein